MTGPALLAALLTLAEPEPATFHGLTLSLGSGRTVCARATFDRRAAQAGGRVLVLDTAGPGDEEAIRLSQAVIVRRGGLASRAGVSARRHGVAAVALGQGRFDARGPVLYVEEPAYGAPVRSAGFSYRPVVGRTELALHEGDAVLVDAAQARVTLISPAEGADRVAASEAALAYDGLRDAQALELWLASGTGLVRAAALLEELAARAAAGAMPVDDFARVRRRAESTVASAAREELRRAESRAYTRAVRQLLRRAEDCAFDSEEARAAAEGVWAMSKLLSVPDEGVAAKVRFCREEARRRAKARAAGLDFAAAAAAAGADRSEGRELPSGSWRAFVESNGLAQWLKETSADASLGLRLKSERIRARILSGALDVSSPAGSAALAAASGPALIIGEDAALKSEGASDVLERVKQAWAASWDPGPLGARLRAGGSPAYEGRVRVERIEAADVSGFAFSRDPGSGRRERIRIEASPGSLERILAGDAEVEMFTLDRGTGREAAPRVGGAAASLSPRRLARVARLARLLDAWKGAGVEVAFSFSGERLLVHHARALNRD